MKRLLVLAALVASFLQIPADTYARPWGPYESVLPLETGTGDVFCSGIVYQGAILTAAHCTRRTPIYARQDGKTYLLRLTRIDDDQDLAIMKSAFGHYFGKGVRLGRREPQVGQSVRVVGFPLGEFGKHMTRGVVSNAYGFYSGKHVLWHDGAILGGNSGGGVFNRYGRLIGVTSFVIVQGLHCPIGCSGLMFQDTSLAGAIHLDAIREFLNQST